MLSCLSLTAVSSLGTQYLAIGFISMHSTAFDEWPVTKFSSSFLRVCLSRKVSNLLFDSLTSEDESYRKALTVCFLALPWLTLLWTEKLLQKRRIYIYIYIYTGYFCGLLFVIFWPSTQPKNAIPRWYTGKKWHIPMASNRKRSRGWIKAYDMGQGEGPIVLLQWYTGRE